MLTLLSAYTVTFVPKYNAIWLERHNTYYGLLELYAVRAVWMDGSYPVDSNSYYYLSTWRAHKDIQKVTHFNPLFATVWASGCVTTVTFLA